MRTYHVSGTLEKYIGNVWQSHAIHTEIEANGIRDAIVRIQASHDDWEFIALPYVWPVSEATKMERDGQPTLFRLEDYNAN